MPFLSATAGDLVEKIATLIVYDPASTLLPILEERARELYVTARHGNPVSFIQELERLKADMIEAQKQHRSSKHDMMAAAMNPNLGPDTYRELIMAFKISDQKIVTTKAAINRLVSDS